MSNSHPNDLGSRFIFVCAWMVRFLVRSFFVCPLWLLLMTCHGRWWWPLGESSICIPLPIYCLISYCLFKYVLLYIGDDIRTVWRDQKRLSEGANRGRTDNTMTTRKKGERLTVVYETQHIILKSEQNEPYSKTGWIRICGKIVVKHYNQQIRCSRRWVVAAPYYTGNVCVAHGPGDDDYFLAVSLWMSCFQYFVFDMQWIVALLHCSV